MQFVEDGVVYKCTRVKIRPQDYLHAGKEVSVRYSDGRYYDAVITAVPGN